MGIEGVGDGRGWSARPEGVDTTPRMPGPGHPGVGVPGSAGNAVRHVHLSI